MDYGNLLVGPNSATRPRLLCSKVNYNPSHLSNLQSSDQSQGSSLAVLVVLNVCTKIATRYIARIHS